MLAVFEKAVAKSPEGLQTPQQESSVKALKDGLLSCHFSSLHPSTVTINLGDSGLISYYIDKQNPLLPRSIPEGAVVFNAEHRVGDRGSFARASGDYAIVISHNPDDARTLGQKAEGELLECKEDY